MATNSVGSVALDLKLNTDPFKKAMSGVETSATKSLGKGSKAFKAFSVGGKIALKGLKGAMKITALTIFNDIALMSSAFQILKKIISVAIIGILAKFAILVALTKQGFSEFIKYDKETADSVTTLNNALNRLRLALGSAFAPIFNAVVPILVKLINWLTRATSAVAQFLSALTGKKTATVVNNASNVGNAVGGIGRNAGNASKKVKELRRTLMGFDKINKLDKNNDGGAGGGGGAGGIGGGVANALQTVEVNKPIQAFVDRLKEAWRKADFWWLGELLATKLNTAMENIPWNKIKKGAWRLAHSLGTFINGFVENFDWGLLGKTLSNAILTIFQFSITLLETINWQKVGKAIVDFIAGIKWGALFKSASRLNGAIVGALAGVFAGAVKEVGKKIKGFFKKAMKDAGGSVIKGFFLGIGRAIKGIAKFIVKKIFKPFIKGFKKAFGISSPSKVMKKQGGFIIDGLLEGLKKKLKKVLNWFGDLPSKVIEAFKNKLGDVGEALGGGLDGLKELVLPVTVSLSDKVSEKLKAIKDAWGKIKTKSATLKAKLSTAIKTGKTAVLTKLKEGWEAIKNKTGTLTAKLEDSIDHGKLSKIIEAWGTFKENAKNITRKLTAKLVTNIKTGKDAVISKLTKAWQTIKDQAGTLTANLKNNVEPKVMTTVKDAWKEFKGFAGNVKRTLTAKLSAFKTGKNSVFGKISSFWNKAKDKTVTLKANFTASVAKAWNTIAKKVNALIAKHPIIFKGIPKLPLLAQGGWVKKNTPQLAVIGDNKREGEIVAPESKLEAMARKVAQESGGNEQVIALLSQLLVAVNNVNADVYLDGEKIKNNTVRRINQHTRSTGKLEIII